MKKNKFLKSSSFWILIFIAVVAVVTMMTRGIGDQGSQTISTTEFMQALDKEEVKEFTMQPGAGVWEVVGEYREEKTLESESSTNDLLLFDDKNLTTKAFDTRVLPNDSTLAEIGELSSTTDTDITILEQDQSGAWISILFTILPLVLFVFFMYMMMGQAGGQGGGGGNRGVMNFGKSKSEDISKTDVKVRFSDVAGADEEKQELVEVVEFLKDPRRFTALGARIPAGVLLEGPPGTGKTLLAKAVAGEAGVPFFSISGSEFVEMFVGVGASRVRDLFENAKKTAPAIIFIDEIDAVGRQRGAGMGGGHDEREQTLNQLLVEMDGFSGNEGVIVIAATNRSDVLDPALLRPGRFDRQILVGRPDVKGREAILKVHSRNKPLHPNVDLKVIAQQTPGFSGADLENLLNEAALVAARRNKTRIDALDLDEAHDRVIAGPAKKDKAISKKEREMVAFHESGHTIVGMVLSDARTVHKVTIVPRGRAGGYAIMLPKEDRFLMTKEELFEQVVGLLGGRTAEEIVFNVQTTGASNDFEQATQLVRSMVTEYGMSDKLGTVQYERNQQVFVGRDYGNTRAYSEDIAYQIDSEVRRIMSEAHERARQIINEHREQLDLIAQKLLEVETLDARTIKSLFETGEMPDEKNSEEYPSEKAASFEEAKRALEKKEAEKLKKDEEDHQEGEDFSSSEESTEEHSDEERTDGSTSLENEDELPPH
ncbi:ATP-dependent zinc metalloprotease FtsH [Jeotgalibaca sp. MA1X17-3]|uniref:ATP-dependent zinc metalloprotease FtsH n=1 Tax=Jeotgalibaca sp. MA1X17-3 TaxID=2908211 RepID=UPI001F17CBCD|nr:ATP-dependent zinc metalloprotease FtsH [Jeotgalibaca sp. MA1X17-3]UJF16212.1 ATP-dependent zinc metalloprotease FtsH [Jeotgalibaca sp. MA1X17-3]